MRGATGNGDPVPLFACTESVSPLLNCNLPILAHFAVSQTCGHERQFIAIAHQWEMLFTDQKKKLYPAGGKGLIAQKEGNSAQFLVANFTSTAVIEAINI